MKAQALTPVFTEYIPAELEPGSLYISMQFETAVHLCACGCRSKVVTPFGPHDWILTFDGTVSLRPSVGNGQQPCRSHYNVRNSRIDWLPRISATVSRAASFHDRAVHMGSTCQSAPQSPGWLRIWNRIRRRRSTL